jgi:ketosteroid isomerase-like protein
MTCGRASADIRGTRFRQAACVQPASSVGLKRNVSRAVVGRRIRIGMLIDVCIRKCLQEPTMEVPIQRSIHALFFVVFICAVAMCSSAQGTAASIESTSSAKKASLASDEIRQMVAKYARSIDEADTGLASQIWLDLPDVSFIHPLGHEHGFEQIKQDVYKHLMGDIFSERKLSPRDIAVHVYGDSAWAEFYWDFNAKFRKDGSPVTTHGRETQVYWKTQDGWRLVHVHYSGMPATQEKQGF